MMSVMWVVVPRKWRLPCLSNLNVPFSAGPYPWCWPSRAHQDFPLQVSSAAGGEGVGGQNLVKGSLVGVRLETASWWEVRSECAIALQ